MAKTKNCAPNMPSTTGKPLGKHRGNCPPKKQFPLFEGLTYHKILNKPYNPSKHCPGKINKSKMFFH